MFPLATTFSVSLPSFMSMVRKAAHWLALTVKVWL